MDIAGMSNIVTVTTLRAPLHETIAFVNYHINSGIDHMILYFDAGDDPAIKLLEKCSRVTCIRCNGGYWQQYMRPRPSYIEERQVINANNALWLARKLGADWIIHIDSDELVYTEGNLGTVLSAMNEKVHAVRFEMREAVPEQLEYENVFKEVTLFKAPAGPRQLERLKAAACRHALYHGEYLRGTRVPNARCGFQPRLTAPYPPSDSG